MFNFIKNWLKSRAVKPYLRFLEDVRADRYPFLLTDTDAELLARFRSFKGRRLLGNKAARLELAEVFCIVREAARRSLGVLPYDVQLMGGLVLANGAVAEMATGEGKTLVAPFAVALQYLAGRQTHISTVNEYLAVRDANMMMPLYRFLGIQVAVSRADQVLEDKRLVYGCDVVYGTHQVFAMDYLSDHLVSSPAEIRQVRGLGFAIVDEADSVLIDDARTPIVLTATRPANPDVFRAVAALTANLKRTADESGEGDFWVDGAGRRAVLTESGYERVSELLVQARLLNPLDADEGYGHEHQMMLQLVVSSLSARHVLYRGQHYVVQDGKIVLVDALTGRLLPGRQWDAGLQQALEAKEGLEISPESRVLARLSLQSYFKLYEGLAGMTGTAAMEAEELLQVYGLPVVTLPLNKPNQRVDEADKFFRTQAAKVDAVVQDIAARHAKGQPILVGTASVEQSDEISRRLTELGLVHEVLNAAQHAREAEIIAQAGAPGAITVSTNMAGRGVNIMLGGNRALALHKLENTAPDIWAELPAEERAALIESEENRLTDAAQAVRAVGGLHVIGMERYESRRMDAQLRGRAGRQGDPGSTCFYISLEDPLVENFAGETIRGIMSQLDIQPGDSFEIELVSKAISAAQRQVEGSHQDARRALVEYDKVLDDQRKAFYAMRDDVLMGNGLHEWICTLREKQVDSMVGWFLPLSMSRGVHGDLGSLRESFAREGVDLPAEAVLRDLEREEVRDVAAAAMRARHEETCAQVPVETLANVERYLVLRVLDRNWFDHLDDLDALRLGINLRVHAKVDPKQAYAKEAFQLFANMLEAVEAEIVHEALTWRFESEPAPIEPVET